MADKNLSRIDGILYVTLPDGRQMKYADFLAYNNPGMQFDDATGEPMAISPPAAAPAADTVPRREYQFGDVGSRMGNETLAAAADTFANAGNVTRSMLPESLQAYVPPSVSYLPDMALGGLLGALGGGEKAIGYGAELGDMAARSVIEGLGFNYPFAPGTGARKLAGDLIGGLDAAGAAPEGRMLGAIVDAAGPAMRRGVMDAASDFGTDEFGGLTVPGRGVVDAPDSSVTAYKLFRTDPRRPGELFPLFVNANDAVPTGEWVDATAGALTTDGKVQSKLGPLAYRPGWHAGEFPIATHIGGKSDNALKAPDYRPANQVWAEIEMPADYDWQRVALEAAQRNKRGEIIPRTAHITDQVPYGGFYRYKTNPNMTGDWLISGGMKVNRVLPDDEVRAINEAAGVADLPRLPGAAPDFSIFDFLTRGR